MTSVQFSTLNQVRTQVKHHDHPGLHIVGKDFKLTLLRGLIYRYLSEVMIFDDSNTVHYNSDKFSEDNSLNEIQGGVMVFILPRGVYTVRITVDGQFTDTRIDLDKDINCVVGEVEYWHRNEKIDYYLEAPKLFSAVPLDGDIEYASTFEYYVGAATDWSERDTFFVNNNSEKCGLFIFLRYPSADIFRNKFDRRTYWSKFKLYDSRNRIVTKFPKGTSEDPDMKFEYNEDLGYLGFSAKVPPGLYFLKYTGKDKRTIPIYVYENWYTQVFMMLEEEPLFGSLKVLLSNDRRFDSKNILHSYVDICLSKLQNEDYTMDEELIDLIAANKFDSPILGLLGAFIYLKSNQNRSDWRFEIIVRNLQRKILSDSNNSQDIYALNFLSYEHFGKTLDGSVMKNTEGTPMFRIAYDVIRRAASIYDWVIPVDSLNDRIAENQYFDSAFNTFKTIPQRRFKIAGKYKGSKVNKVEMIEDEWRVIEKSLPPIFTQGSYSLQTLLESDEPYDLLSERMVIENREYNKALPPDFVREPNLTNYSYKEQHLKDLLKNPKIIGRVGFQVASLLLEHGNLSNRFIANRINLPISTIKRVRDNFEM